MVRATANILVPRMQTKEIDGTDFCMCILEKSIVSVVGVDGLKNEASDFPEIMVTACDATCFKNVRLWNPAGGRSNRVFDKCTCTFGTLIEFKQTLYENFGARDVHLFEAKQ